MLSWCVRRSEKSQVLNEEQQSLEKRVDQLRLACQNVSKKVQTCLMTQGKSTDSDKRLVLHSYTTTKNLILLLQLWPVVSIQIYLKVNVRGAEIPEQSTKHRSGVWERGCAVPSVRVEALPLGNLWNFTCKSLHLAAFCVIWGDKKTFAPVFFLGASLPHFPRLMPLTTMTTVSFATITSAAAVASVLLLTSKLLFKLIF